MGWIIYDTQYRAIKRYTHSETAAKRMVTAHNRKAIVALMQARNIESAGVSEWKYCDWNQYESMFAENYQKNSWQYR